MDLFLGTNQPIRLPGLSLDFALDGEPFGRLRAMSCVEWLIEAKPGVRSGLILSDAFCPDLKVKLPAHRAELSGEEVSSILCLLPPPTRRGLRGTFRSRFGAVERINGKRKRLEDRGL
jgi:hypothetical protein